ncbi:hypothetical protein TYRP_021058 [Tyrophagus putrescentiae]|nr:hypothetical protein TYRP_021058 [Tyrophagus putrescentiae]
MIVSIASSLSPFNNPNSQHFGMYNYIGFRNNGSGGGGRESGISECKSPYDAQFQHHQQLQHQPTPESLARGIRRSRRLLLGAMLLNIPLLALLTALLRMHWKLQQKWAFREGGGHLAFVLLELPFLLGFYLLKNFSHCRSYHHLSRRRTLFFLCLSYALLMTTAVLAISHAILKLQLPRFAWTEVAACLLMDFLALRIMVDLTLEAEAKRRFERRKKQLRSMSSNLHPSLQTEESSKLIKVINTIMHACIQSSATIAKQNYYTVGAIKNFRYYDDESERIHDQQDDQKNNDHRKESPEEEEEEEHRLAQNQGVLCGLLLLNLFLLLVLYLAIETSGPMTRWRQKTTTTSSSSINSGSFLERFLNEQLITDDDSSSSSYLFRLSVLRLAALVGLLLETPFFIAFCSLKNDLKNDHGSSSSSSSPTLQILLLTAHALLLTGAVIATAQVTVRLHLWPFWAAEVLLAVLVDVTSLAMVVDLVHQINGGGSSSSGKKRIGRGRGEQKLSSCGIQLRRSGRKVNEVARRCGCCLVKRCTESVVRI